MGKAFDDWLGGYKESPTAVAEPATFDDWLRQNPQVKEQAQASMGLGEQAKIILPEAVKAGARAIQDIPAAMSDALYMIGDLSTKPTAFEKHIRSQPGAADNPQIQAYARALPAQRKAMRTFATNVSDYWRTAQREGWEKKDPRIDKLKWSEAPILKGLVSGIESSGTFLTSVAASVVTGNPAVGLAILSAESAGGMYKELIAEGVDEDIAGPMALLAGTFEGVSEHYLGFDKLFTGTAKTLLRKFLKSGAREGLQEFFQNMGENYIRHFAKEYDETGEPSEALKISWAELLENWQEAISGGLVMGAGGAVLTGRAGVGEVEAEGLPEAPPPQMGQAEKGTILKEITKHFLTEENVDLESDVAKGVVEGVQVVEPQGEEQMAADEVARRLGKDTIWFIDPSRTLGMRGLVAGALPGTIFMNAAQGADATMFVMSHEIGHQLQLDSPELYEKFADIVEGNTTGFERFVELDRIKKLDSRAQRDEFVADMFGQAARQPGFWDKVFQAEPTLGQKVLQIIRNVINRLKPYTPEARETDALTASFITNIFAIEKAAAKAAKKYAPVAKEQADVRLLRREAKMALQAGQELTTPQQQALKYTDQQLRDLPREFARKTFRLSEDETTNRQMRTLANAVEGPYKDHAWTFLSSLQYEEGLSPRTVAAYLTAVRDFSRFMGDKKKVQAVQPEDLRAYKQSLGKAGRAAATVNLRMAALNEFFGFLTQTNQIAGNPMLALADERAKGEKKLPRVLSVPQMRKFVKTAREKSRPSLKARNTALAEILWATGARSSEVTEMKVGDLRLGERLITLHGKGAKDRLVPITPSTATALQAHIEGAGLQRNDYLFQTRTGKQMYRQDIHRFVKEIVHKAGLPSWVSTHSLRHTFATHLMEGGVDIRFIQEMMGHSTPEITALYAHVTIKRKKAVFKKYHPSEVGILKPTKAPVSAEGLRFAEGKPPAKRKYVTTKEGKLVRAPSMEQLKKAPARGKKRTIARTTGMEVPGKAVSEEKALRGRMQAQETAAKMGVKAGLAMGKAKAQALKDKYKTLAEWRKAFRKYVKKSLPGSAQGTMLTALEGIKGEKSYAKALERLLAKIEQVQRTEALSRAKKHIKKIQKKWGRKGTFGGYKLLPEYERILTRSLERFTTKREMTEGERADLEELLVWATEEQAKLEATGEMDSPLHQHNVIPTIQSLKTRLGAISIAKWPAEDIDAYTDSLLAVVYQHLYERTAFNRVMRERLEFDIAQGVSDVGDAAGRPVESLRDVGAETVRVWTKVKDEARAFLGRRNFNISTLAKIMSGMKGQGPVWRRLAGNIEQGLGKALGHKQAVQDLIWRRLADKGVAARDIMSMSKVLKRGSWQGPKWLKKLAESDWDAEGKNFVSVPTQYIKVALDSGKSLKLSVGEAIDIFMHTRNPDNYKALLGPNGISFYGKPVQEGQSLTDADVDAITDAMFEAAPKARAVIEVMEEAVAFQQDAINVLSRRILGYDLATLPGYWHIRRLLPKKPRGKQAAYAYETIEGRSHLKERVGGSDPIVIGDAFNNLIETVAVGADYVGLAEPLRNAKTMIGNKEFRAAAEKNGFGKYLDDISWQIGQIESPKADRIWFDRWLAAWTRNVTRAIFGHNLRIAAQQEISVFLAFAHLPFRYAKALRAAVTADVVARIELWSPYIRDRFAGHISREVGDIAETGGPLRFWTGKDQYANHGTFLIRHFDKRAIVNVWRMVEAEVADKATYSHLTREEMYNNGAYRADVVARAEQIMRDTQPTWHKIDRSIIGSHPSSGAKILTMFHSQREKMVQMAGQAIAEYKNSPKDRAAKWKMARTYGMVGLNLALVNAWKVAFATLIMGRKDEPEEWATNVLADIPGMFYVLGPPVRESVKAASRSYRHKRVYQLGSVSLPPLKILESGRDAGYAWNKVAFELLEGHNVEKELGRALDKTWDFSQYALGLPFKSVTDIAKKWSE